MNTSRWNTVKNQFRPKRYRWGVVAATVAGVYGTIFTALLVLDQIALYTQDPDNPTYTLPLMVPGLFAMPWTMVTFCVADWFSKSESIVPYLAAVVVAGALNTVSIWFIFRGKKTTQHNPK